MYQTILVPVDGSPAANAGLDEAIRLARKGGGRLHLMNVVDDTAFTGGEGGDAEAPNGASAGSLARVVRERGEHVLRHARSQAEAEGVVVSTALVRSRAEGLQDLVARQAEECGADLIVLGTHGQRGLSRLLMSNQSEHLLNVVTVPVLLVRSADAGPDLSVVELTATDSMFQTAP